MPDKYSFNEILKEYNEKYGCEYSLSPEVDNVFIVRTVGDSKFYVTYSNIISMIKTTKCLGVFIRTYISCNITQKDIENIILSKENEKLNLRIEIWPSSKIRYAYLEDSYFAKDVGNLGKSCMRVKTMQKALNFYVKNNIKIVVAIDDKNKIYARALLWDNVKSTKLKKPFTYLDRVYAKSDTLCPLFYDLAKENKWKFYPSTTVNKMNKTYYKKDMIVAGVCHLPFMDTFRYLYPKDNLLTSSTSIGLNINNSTSYVTLNEHTNCGYYPRLDPNRIQEALTGLYISKKDAIFIKKYKNSYDGYVLEKNIADINGDYYSICDNRVVKTTTDGYILKENSVVEVFTGEIIDKNKSIHSIDYKGYIHESNVVYIRYKLYHKLDTNIICFGNKWYDISQCFVNHDRKGMNEELVTQKGYIHCPENYTPYWKRTTVDDQNSKYAGLLREGKPIPKEHTIIAYDVVYNPIVDDIEYQEVYCTNTDTLIQLTTGEFVVNSSKNKQHLKKFNNKWYIKREFKPPDKKQLTLFEDIK